MKAFHGFQPGLTGRTIEGDAMSAPDAHVSVAQWVARAVAIAVLVPLRLAWEAVTLLGRIAGAALRYVMTRLLAPTAELLWHWVIRPAWVFLKDFLWGWVLQHVLWGLVLTPLGAILLDHVLRPMRRAVERYLWRKVIRPVSAWLSRRVLVPLGRAVAWLCYQAARWLIGWPLYQLWRWVLRPLRRGTRAVACYGWRVATVVVGVLVVIPCRAIYRTVLRPALAVVVAGWHVLVARPIRWVHSTVVRPMNRWASDVVSAVFGR